MTEVSHLTAAEILKLIIGALGDLDEEDRKRVLKSVASFYGFDAPSAATPHQNTSPHGPREEMGYTSNHAPTPKEFMIEKRPRTDVERIACLAYYLTHFRDTPYFKTIDLAKLNTEAAQPKFSNAAYAATNAVNMRYLALATKGQRQLSAPGEQFVSALPDRDAAKQAMEQARPRRRQRKQPAKVSQPV